MGGSQVRKNRIIKDNKQTAFAQEWLHWAPSFLSLTPFQPSTSPKTHVRSRYSSVTHSENGIFKRNHLAAPHPSYMADNATALQESGLFRSRSCWWPWGSSPKPPPPSPLR